MAAVVNSYQKIDADVQAALAQGTWDEAGRSFTMPPLSRALYLKVSKVLKAFGGAWNRKANATVFDDEDVAYALQDAAFTGQYLDLRKSYQQFDTPAELADALADHSELSLGLAVLEPSAGHGNLLKALHRRMLAMVPDAPAAEFDESESDLEPVEFYRAVAVELDPERVQYLQAEVAQGNLHCQQVWEADFLTTDPDVLGQFDRVLMNPPFSRGQDMRHVMHAAKFLKPAGRLVAVMSAGFTFRQDRLARDFREWYQTSDYRGVYFDNPEGSFRAEKTEVRTVTFVLDHIG